MDHDVERGERAFALPRVVLEKQARESREAREKLKREAVAQESREARESLKTLRKRISRRRRCSPLRLCLLLLVAAAACTLQLMFVHSFLPVEDDASAAAAVRVVEPTALPAEAEEEADSSSTPGATPSPPPTPPPEPIAAQGDSAAHRSDQLPSTASRHRARKQLVWDFGSPTHGPGAVQLHGCTGQGTYGAVINASADGIGPVVLKLPVLRHWGFKFFRAESHALQALDSSVPGGSVSVRNVVGLSGNVSLDVRWLLALAQRGARGDSIPTDDSGFLSDEDAAASDSSAANEPARWSCLNVSDLHHALSIGVERLPAMLLEPLQTTSVFKLLAAVAAPMNANAGVDVTAGEASAGSAPTLDSQRRIYRGQVEALRNGPADMFDAFRHTLVLLTGVAHGLNALHRARVLHRDLTEPGKNALLRRDAIGLTAVMIDLSQAEVCPPGRGAAGRAVDMYGFGNLLFFACYGQVAHSLPWTRYSCTSPPKGLDELQRTHRRLHPDGRAAPRSLFNRCHEKLRAPLDALMHYSWAPALAMAHAAGDAGSVEATPLATSLTAHGIGEAAARVNHTWAEAFAQLDAMRALHVPLFRFI